MPHLSSPLRCFAFFLASHPVTLSRWCLYIFQSNPHKYLEAAALPRQALTGANRARSGCVLQALLLYIATTCTRFQLCRLWIYVACVCVCACVCVFCGPLEIHFSRREYVKEKLCCTLSYYVLCECACERMCIHCVTCASDQSHL